MKAVIEPRRVGDLKLDDNFWPRRLTRIDDVNLGRIREAIRAGKKLPPPRADIKTLIISDGWHRVTAYKGMFDDDHLIDVELMEYPTKNDILIDAVKINGSHGMALDTKDRIDVILRLRERRVSVRDICEALGITSKAYERYMKRTLPNQDGELVALPRGAEHLCEIGKPLTREQERQLPKIGGVEVTRQARMLIAQIRVKTTNFENATELATLIELRDLLIGLLQGVNQ